MRLLVCGPGHPFRGGIAKTTTELVRTLRGRGHEVLFLTPRRQYPRWLFPGADDRDPAACRRLDGAVACLDPFSPLTWPEARCHALAAAADAWILPYWTWAWAGCWRFLLQGDRRPPVVTVVHNLADHDAGPLQRTAARLVLVRSQGLFTHAAALATQLRREHWQVPVHSYPLPPVELGGATGERAAQRLQWQVPAGARIALFAGLIRPYKGVDLLLEAVARLSSASPWYLLVCGEPWGELGSALRRQVAALGIADRVHLDLRWLPEQEMAAALAAADLVVLPYRHGSQSAVAPVALARGTPVLSTAVGGLPEVIEHGVNGLLVPPGSVAALTAALEQLDEHLLGRLSAGARGSARLLSWSAYASALEQLLATL